jgi:integrase
MIMSSVAINQKIVSIEWQWQIDLNRYDRSLELTANERLALKAILKGPMKNRYRDDVWRSRLGRLLDPILDALKITRASSTHCGLVIKLILQQMRKRGTSFWKWTESEWAGITCGTIADFERKNAVPVKSRPYFLAVCVLLRRVRDLRHLGNFDRIGLARKVFGTPVEASVKRIADVLTAWGYSSELSRIKERSSLCEIFLMNCSPLLEDISSELLVELHKTRVTEERRWTLQRISNALCALKLIVAPIPHGFDKARGGNAKDVRAGVPEKWQAIAERWLATSTLSEKGRAGTYYLVMKAGRWAAALKPDVALPELWTRDTAAAYVAAVCRMRIGEWVNQVNRPSERGKPLTPRSICGHLTALRIFFRDCQEWEWIPRRFDPNRCLQPPTSVKARIGPDPRILAEDIWAKLLWAGLNMEERDLNVMGSQHHYYPLALVRGLTIIWLFAGLRSDEILRLRVGSIRWKRNEGEGNTARTCLLHVPVNKTSAAFVKPVDAVVGEAIENWEAVRPQQPPLLDKKTGELVDYLFTYRTRQPSRRYLNQVLIPALCAKAGIPRSDARGAITSHRGRATIATQLFNAKEPLSLFELQEWMGHRSPQSTQYYAKISATKMVQSFAKAGYFERNLRTIEVLIDQEVVRNGMTNNEPWKYYDLGHGYCAYDFFDQCPHRMACAKCSFYRPKASAKGQLLEGKENLLRLRQEIPLQETEIAAVDEGINVFESLVNRLIDTPTPAGPTPRQLQRHNLVQIRRGKEAHRG